MALVALTAGKKAFINKMNRIAKSQGLGDLFSNMCIYSALTTTTAGSATLALTISGIAVGDIPIVTINTVGATPRTITTAKVTATDTLTVVFSGDPSTDHVLNIAIHRVV